MTMVQEEVDLVGRVALDVRNAVLTWCAVNSCIESTRLGLLVFERLGIPARPQPVRVAVMNKASWQLMNEGVPIELWPESAHNLGVGFLSQDDNPDGWNGHLVAIVREPGKPRHLIDISADQFDRPGRLNVPGPVGMTINHLWTPTDPVYRVLQDNDTILDYRPFAPGDPIGNAYKDAPAWNNDPEDFAGLADYLADRIREDLG